MHVAITFAVAAAAAVAGMAAPAAAAAAAPAAGQSALPNPPAVFGWGWNLEGEVGDGTTTPRATPVPVLGLPSVNGSQAAMKQVVSGYFSQACAGALVCLRDALPGLDNRNLELLVTAVRHAAGHPSGHR